VPPLPGRERVAGALASGQRRGSPTDDNVFIAMSTEQYYRGGPSMKPTLRDVRIDRATGLVLTSHGVSVFNRPDNLGRFRGAYRLTFVPVELT